MCAREVNSKSQTCSFERRRVGRAICILQQNACGTGGERERATAKADEGKVTPANTGEGEGNEVTMIRLSWPSEWSCRHYRRMWVRARRREGGEGGDENGAYRAVCEGEVRNAQSAKVVVVAGAW